MTHRPDPGIGRNTDLSEWPIVALAIGSAVFWFVAGVSLALATGQPYWLNRCGALIVASEGLIMAAESRQERRLHGLQEAVGAKHGDPEFAKAFAKAVKAAKSSVVRIGLMLAVFGEVVHGFGDVVLSSLFGLHTGSH